MAKKDQGHVETGTHLVTGIRGALLQTEPKPAQQPVVVEERKGYSLANFRDSVAKPTKPASTGEPAPQKAGQPKTK